jgi:hypothetical protein
VTKSLARRREASALVVGQPEAAPLQLLLKDVVLLDQILDDLLLVAIDPSSEGHEQQPYGGEIGSHRRDRTVLHLGPEPGTNSAEFRTLRA